MSPSPPTDIILELMPPSFNLLLNIIARPDIYLPKLSKLLLVMVVLPRSPETVVAAGGASSTSLTSQSCCYRCLFLHLPELLLVESLLDLLKLLQFFLPSRSRWQRRR
ncbi:hypothetical protein CRG98_032215 [Punica granatum]|uniref:Uncharacterized protein n=1 Tax=Punica granatum TaxID=22663 RepID=A0A2I0IUP3_PUNGR|nr:hypothetical protein CRG98_032215 [Punica granatum]